MTDEPSRDTVHVVCLLGRPKALEDGIPKENVPPGEGRASYLSLSRTELGSSQTNWKSCKRGNRNNTQGRKLGMHRSTKG